VVEKLKSSSSSEESFLIVLLAHQLNNCLLETDYYEDPPHC